MYLTVPAPSGVGEWRGDVLVFGHDQCRETLHGFPNFVMSM